MKNIFVVLFEVAVITGCLVLAACSDSEKPPEAALVETKIDLVALVGRLNRDISEQSRQITALARAQGLEIGCFSCEEHRLCLCGVPEVRKIKKRKVTVTQELRNGVYWQTDESTAKEIK